MLVKIYGLTVERRVDAVSTELDVRESIALIGPNGAGKTTLFQAMSGLIRHDGWVQVRGTRLNSMTPQRRALAVAYVSEDLKLEFDWTLEEVVLMGRYAHGAIWGPRTSEAQGLLDAVMKHLDLESLWDRPFRSLSGGERQLGLIARAWFQQSALVLFDETTSKLDFDHKEKVRQWVTGEKGPQTAQSMIWVDHDHAFLKSVAPRSWLLARGQLVFDGPTDAALETDRLHSAYQKKMVVPI